MEYFLISLLSLSAFFLKGVTGTGTTTVIIAVGSLFIDPKLTVVLSSFVNIFGGLSMVRVDPLPLPRRYWMPISILMIAGSVVGAITLDRIPSLQFQVILGGVFLLTAFWFLFNVPAPFENRKTPASADSMDLSIGTLAGFCGGFIGINGPPLVLHFSQKMDKRQLRRLLVLIFIPAAIAQTVTFMVSGLFNRQVMMWGLLMIPSMFVGIWLGNRTFHHISEIMFRRTLGLLLVFVSIRLIWKGMSSLIL